MLKTEQETNGLEHTEGKMPAKMQNACQKSILTNMPDNQIACQKNHRINMSDKENAWLPKCLTEMFVNPAPVAVKKRDKIVVNR